LGSRPRWTAGIPDDLRAFLFLAVSALTRSSGSEGRNLMRSRAENDRMANAIRALARDAVEQAKSGHPGLPMGAADVATVLFTQFLKFDPDDPHSAALH